LKLLHDFVSRGDAEEWAKENGINSYTILETVVNHEVKIVTQVQPARALRVTGEVAGDGEPPLPPRSGPVEGSRNTAGSKDERKPR
jgi:hypothetical protein